MATPEDRLPGGGPPASAPDTEPERVEGAARGVPCKAEDCLFHDGMANCALKPSEIQIGEARNGPPVCETYEPEEGVPAGPPAGGQQRVAQPSPMSPPQPSRQRVPPA